MQMVERVFEWSITKCGDITYILVIGEVSRSSLILRYLEAILYS